tara:strand:+ start:1187 stop:2356 length:1170 start_codon:yes stop_codon:yes gene_type:complete
MDKLLKEAIADAKAVRETAIANAKLALEEAFTPKLQSMLSAKIREEEEEEIEDVPAEMAMDEPEMDSEAEMSHGDEGMDGYGEEMGDEEEGMGGYGEEMESDETEDGIIEINGVQYAPVISEDDMEGSEEEMEVPAEGPSMESEEEPAEDMELESIIRELEDEMDTEEEPVAEQSDSSDIGNGDNKVVVADGDDEEKAETETSPGNSMGSEDENMDKISEGEEAEEEEPVDLEEIIKSLSEDQYTAGVDDGEAGESVEQPESPVSEIKLKEAYATIRFMRDKLQEVNLLNAKLLFTNKLFRNNGLDEGQKLRVIETFDRAGSVREVKLVYSTLAESLKYDAKATKKVNKITEGLASKPSKSTKPSAKSTPLNEGNVMADRFKKLAGLIK